MVPAICASSLTIVAGSSDPASTGPARNVSLRAVATSCWLTTVGAGPSVAASLSPPLQAAIIAAAPTSAACFWICVVGSFGQEMRDARCEKSEEAASLRHARIFC